MKTELVTRKKHRLWITASGFVESGGEARKALLQEVLTAIGRCDAEGLQVAFVLSAGIFISKPQQHWPESWNFLQEAGCTLQKIEHYDLNSFIIGTLRWADVIYIEGGNPSYLLQWLRSKRVIQEFLTILEQGKPCIGASAGGMIFGESLALSQYGKEWAKPRSDIENLDGLRLIPCSVWPHYGRRWWHSLALGKARRLCGGEVLTLTDGEWAYFGK